MKKNFRRAAIPFAVAVAAACGTDLLKKEDSDAKDQAPGEVEFSGYVQKAFTIKVNGSEFADSEQFYTQFIDKLVKPAYPTLDGSKVEIEGKYGLEEFGVNTKVFMSSMPGDGYLFESRTDQQSKFTVKVQAKALDEIYKARAIIRIGLVITAIGKAEHYCYILHGNRESIVVSESSKPIIFDDFKTQLNTYKCEDVNENELVIPGQDGVPGDDGRVITNEDGTQSVEPYARVIDTIKIASVPASDVGATEDATKPATNALLAVYSDANGALHILKAPVRSKTSGDVYYPLVSSASLKSPKLGHANLPPIDSGIGGASSIVKVEKSWLVSDTDYSKIYKTDIDGSNPELLTAGKYVLLAVGGKMLAIDPEGVNVCELNLGTGNVDAGTCKSGSFSFKAAVAFTGNAGAAAAIYKDADTWRLGVFNPAMVLQKNYAVSKLQISEADISTAKLHTDGSSYFIVNLKAGQIVLRQLELIGQ